MIRAAVGKVAFSILKPFVHAYFRARPMSSRVRVIVRSPADKILLQRTSFGHQQWSLPGGGISRGEMAADAAIREVHEETGIRLTVGSLRQVAEFVNQDAYTPYRVILFEARTVDEVVPRPLHRLEILEAAWWPVGALPDMAKTSSLVQIALAKTAKTTVS